MTKKSLAFNDAQEMAIKYPKTFEAPTKEDLDNLKVGDFVKVSVVVPNRTDGMPESERFWTEITSIENDVIKAKVSNDLLCVDLLYQEEISFNKKHIYST